MTTNGELIEETTKIAVLKDFISFRYVPAAVREYIESYLSIAKQSGVRAPVEVTERERLADDARMESIGLRSVAAFENKIGHVEMADVLLHAAETIDSLAAGFRAPAADGDSAQSRIDQHMQKIAHRVMDVFENAEEDTLADDIMQDVFEAIGLTESFGVESEEGAA